jgi:hypothetical protein
MPYADPEQLVATWLVANVFPGSGQDRVRVETGEVDPEKFNVQHAMRLIRIVQLPSSPGDAEPTLDIADLELNWYARTRDRARDIANQTRAEMRYRLEKATDPTTGAFVKQVRWPGTPVQVPSDTAMYFRYRGTARLVIHHNPLA